MAWWLLFAAGMVEIGMALSLKLSNGWSRSGPGLAGILLGVASVVMLTKAMKTLPVGTAYAVWTGIGAVGVSLVGIVVLGESASPPRLACIALIVTGIVGLRLLDMPA